MPKKSRSRPRPHKTFSVKLFYDEHAALIEWLDSLPMRKRGDVVRDMIARCISPQNEYAEILRRLDVLENKLDRGVAVAAPAKAMDDSTAEKMRANVRKATW